MSPVAWLVVWGLAIATLAFFTIRSWRAGRRGVDDIGDVDKMRHTAHQEAGMRRDGSGPNSVTGLWIG
jgi:hypothetical protein